jgi:hypothetical protein
MQLTIGPHLDSTEIEQYSMGTLPEPRIPGFEEHFLACEACQDQLLEMEAYVNAVRSVSPKLRAASRPQGERWAGWRWPAWIAATAVLAAALFVVRGGLPGPVRRGEMAILVLQTSRGIDGLEGAKVSAGQPLLLQINLTEIPPSSSYRLEVVDSPGQPEWVGAGVPEGGKIVQQLPKGLSAGRHYVRLYGASGELLREFRLQVN